MDDPVFFPVVRMNGGDAVITLSEDSNDQILISTDILKNITYFSTTTKDAGFQHMSVELIKDPSGKDFNLLKLYTWGLQEVAETSTPGSEGNEKVYYVLQSGVSHAISETVHQEVSLPFDSPKRRARLRFPVEKYRARVSPPAVYILLSLQLFERSAEARGVAYRAQTHPIY
jgi:hypothetical protein